MAPESDLRSDNSSVVLTKDNTNFTQEAPLPDKLSTAASAQLSASREVSVTVFWLLLSVQPQLIIVLAFRIAIAILQRQHQNLKG